MGLQGKGFFIWKIDQCEGGEAKRIARQAKKAGLSHVILKIANGIFRYNYDWKRKHDLAPPVVSALRSEGIEVWGWHYVFGDQPVQEARIAVKGVQELNLDGYVIDAESEYKVNGKKTAAKRFMSELRNGLGNSVPIALSSYRYPSLHPIPWNEFLEKCDYNMPQVYWLHSDNPDEQLGRMLDEFESPRIKYHPPIIPTGPAFKEHGWEPNTKEITNFLDTTRSMNLQAANFWEWYACREVLNPKHEIWDLISDYKWEIPPPKPKDVCEHYIDALNSLNPGKVTDLYHDKAVHITSERTLAGKENLRTWYETLFIKTLPNANFRLTGYSGSGSSRHFTWTAVSLSNRVLDGSDTFGILDDKISYHYTKFSVNPVEISQIID